MIMADLINGTIKICPYKNTPHFPSKKNTPHFTRFYQTLRKS